MKRFRFSGRLMGLPMRSRPTAEAGRGQQARYCNLATFSSIIRTD